MLTTRRPRGGGEWERRGWPKGSMRGHAPSTWPALPQKEHPTGAAGTVAMGAPSTRARAKHAAAAWLLRPQRVQ